MSNTIKGFKTLSGEAYYDYNYLKNQPTIPSRLSELENDENYIDGAYVLDNSLFLTSNGRVIEGPLGPFAQGEGEFTEIDPTVPSWAKQPSKPAYSANEVGAEKIGAVSTHNTASGAHNDIRILINELTNRLNALANSDDTTLDQMKEIVDYIKSNRALIESVTTTKVNISDIINNLSTNTSSKPLSASQGVVLKTLIDSIAIPTKVSQLENDKNYLTSYTEKDPTVPSWAKQSSKPSYTAEEVGAEKSGTVSTHNSNNQSHADIRQQLTSLGSEIENLKIDTIKTFDIFPTQAEINQLSANSYFRTKGFYSKNDGLGCLYKVLAISDKLSIKHGNMYFRPVNVDGDNRDLFVDYYGLRRHGDSSYASKNSAIINELLASIPHGYTLHFGSGHYYFSDSLICPNSHVAFKGAVTNACVIVSDVNYGTYLHFSNLSNGSAAISIKGGIVQDLGIVGNPNISNVTINREAVVTNKDGAVSEVNNGTTYGIKVVAGWGMTIQNVKLKYFTYGIYSETCNGLISHVNAHNCKIGISIGNDIKINTVQLWDVITGIQLRGPLASATNIRGDSIGKHLIECWRGKCLLSNIDGDFCLGSLIHYGNGEQNLIHLGQANLCMGRIATKYAYNKEEDFDLANIPDEDYEYCSYISIAPNTQVFGGMIDMVNSEVNIYDTSSDYIHPSAALSIAAGSTVKGVVVKYNLPYNADVEYFNKKVIKNLSQHNHSMNNSSTSKTDFDGTIIEDINFITPIGMIRSKRTQINKDRVIEFSNNIATAVKYEEQNLTDLEKLQARKNIGLEDVSSLKFVNSEDACVDGNNVYVLPDGTIIAGETQITHYYENKLSKSIDSTGAIYNEEETPGYRLAYFSGDYGEAVPEYNSWYLTGYIPVQIGDVVRFDKMDVMDMTATSSAQVKTSFKFYDENFTHIVTSASYYPGGLPSSAWAAEYNNSNNIAKVKIPTSYSSSIKYMRLCAKYIGAESIITVNQEIRLPEITSTFGDTDLRLLTKSKAETVNNIDSQLNNKLSTSGGNLTGHIYLTGAKESSSTGSTSQIVFGTQSNNHVAISSNTNAIVINPDINSTKNQIVLYLDKPSQFPSGLTGNLTGTASRASADGSGNNIINTYATKAELSNLENQMGQDNETIPEYWQEHLDARVNDINTAIEAAGKDKSAFLWYTDAHWGYGSKMSPKLMQYLCNNTAITKINFGGDFGNSYEYPEVERDESYWIGVLRDFKKATRALPNHHSVIGNHDYNGSNGAINYLNCIKDPNNYNHLYGFALAQEETFDITSGTNFSYYIDNPSERTRYLYLNTSFCWETSGKGEDGQGWFVVDSLSSTPKGWHIIAISHIWLGYDSSNGYTLGPVPTYCQKLLDLFDSYNARRNGATTIGNESLTYDFSKCEGKIEFCIGGHIHVDHDFTSTEGIPVILTRTDSYHWRLENGSTSSEGSNQESAVSAIIADYDNKKVNIIRIGRGSSRIVALSELPAPGGGNDEPVNYTNQLPIATDFGIPGSRYGTDETPGYKSNIRISVSNNTITDKEESGWYATGFMPVKSNSIIRLKNCVFKYDPTDTNYRVQFVTADYNKQYNSNDKVQNIVNMSKYNISKEADGNIVKFQLPNINGAEYIRIVCQHLDNSSIITIDEEID